MKVFGRVLLFLLCACVFCSTTAGYAEQGDVDMSYRTEEIWCENGSSRIYGVACIPETEGRLPLVIFSHELGNNHEAGVRYAECLAAHGYAAYVFDFCGGSAGGTQNRSDGSNSEMSVLTEASDLSSVLDAAKAWPFVDSEKIFLLGGSQGGLVTIITGCERQDELAGIIAITAVQAQQIAAQNECCCSTKMLIAETGSNLAAQIAQNKYENALALAGMEQRITAKMDQNEITSLRDQVQQLQLAQATAGVLRFPNQWRYGAGPFPPIFGCPGSANI